jgi:glucose-6-phosphate 1-dehydrogenase
MPVTLLDVVLVLQPPPRDLFRGPDQRPQSPNRIQLRLQPDAGVTFTLLAKRPGSGDLATEVPVSVDFRTALGPTQEPYERILSDALAGDPAHFARMDNVEEAWRIVDPALNASRNPSPTRRAAGDRQIQTQAPPAGRGSRSTALTPESPAPTPTPSCLALTSQAVRCALSPPVAANEVPLTMCA